MKNIRTTAALLLAVSLFVVAGQAAVAQDDIASGPKPAWVVNSPKDNNQFMYFRGFGSSASGNLNEAQQFAIDDIRSQIMQFIGVKVTSTTTTAAVGTLDDFQASISKQVTESASAHLAGARVEKWHEKTAAGVIVHVLVTYEKESILFEKRRIEKIIIDEIASVTFPEGEGARLAAEGRLYEATVRYIEAAVAASESKLEDSAVALNRTLASAMETLSRINLFKLNDNLSAMSGEEPVEDFKLKVAAGASPSSKGVPKAVIQVTYSEVRGNAEPAKRAQSVPARDDGQVAFRHPPLTFVGQGKVLMVLDLSAYLDKLKTAAKKAPEKVAALRALAASKQQEFYFTALSRVQKLPLAVFVVDVDENGKPLPGNQSTASGINEALTKQGFKLKTAGLDPSLAGNTEDDELAALIKKKVPGAERAIVGTAMVESSYKDKERYIVKVTGTVKVIDLASMRILYEKSHQKNYTGASLEAARAAAFKQLGRELGQKVATDMR